MRPWRFALAYVMTTLSAGLLVLAVSWRSLGWAVAEVAQALVFGVVMLAEVQRWLRGRRAP